MTRLDATARGVFVISVTPFADDGALDLDGVGRLMDFYLAHGVSGVTILGMMGEAPKLSAAEARAFVEAVCRHVDGRIPVVVGVSSAGFAAMSELATLSMDAGAAGVMVAPPASVRTDAQIVDYFQSAADALGDIPFVLQDFPLATNVQIAPDVIGEIVRRIDTCVMLKHEDWPGLNKITALRDIEEKGGRRISILCGNGGLFLPEELGRGADGAMTGYAYPEMLVDICRLHAAGDTDAAAELFDAHLPLVRYEQQPGAGLAVRKYVLARRGAIASSGQRKPGRRLSALEAGEVENLIARLERRLGAN
ncbi:MAG: dihydrodipicolinate synthase family protein [Sphingomonas sp.]|uniref:dihydrodipicolinate synthase family protein n=1 Tax=Sphingomonas sp. TaxID=28214 RepID=UPI003F7F4C3D